MLDFNALLAGGVNAVPFALVFFVLVARWVLGTLGSSS